MNREQQIETLTAIVASAFTHYRETMKNGNAKPPTPEESKSAYLNDPIINRFTNATVIGVLSMHEALNFSR